MPKLRIAVAVSVALFAATVAIGWRRSIDSEEADRFGRSLRRLTALDARANEAVLRSRFGLSADYDLLVDSLDEARRLLRRAHDAPKFLDAAAQRELASAVDAADRAERTKETLIERFKSENSVLRNSMRFFPLEASRLTEAFLGDPRAADLATDLRWLNADLLLYGLFPDRDLAARVEQRRAGLAADAEKAHRADELSILDRHVAVILGRTPVVDRLAGDILASPTSRLNEALDATYTSGYSRVASRLTQLRFVAAALALLVVVLAATDVILRQRKAAADLERATSELRRALFDLEKERERERELIEMKSRFVSLASHEFRTPLSVILSSTELLSEYGASWSEERKRQHTARIVGAVRGMVEMLDAVLTIGKSDAGADPVRPEPVRLVELCEEIVSSLRQSSGHRHVLELVEDGELDEVATMDPRHLRHILTNLLSNAVKYSPDGGVVRLTLSQPAGRARFSVRDAGIGIPAEDRKQLFERFARGGNVGAIPGTGLGLAIVKRSVDACGGTIAVESEVGRGTTFIVELPLASGRDA